MSLSTEDQAIVDQGGPINPLIAKLTGDIGKKLDALMSEGANASAVPAVAAAAPASPAPTPAPAAAAPTPAPAPLDPSDDPAIPEPERPPKGAAKATKEDWMRFRALMNGKLEAREKDFAKLNADLETLRKAAPVKGIPLDEHERLKAEADELRGIVERTALEQSPRFRQHYASQIDQQWELIRSAAGEHAKEVEKLLSGSLSTEARARWKELREELGPDGDIIVNALGNIRRLSVERDTELKNYKVNLKLLRDREAAEALEASAKASTQRKSLADTIVAQASSLAEFKAPAGDVPHGTFAAEALNFIRSANMGELSPSDMALLPVQAMRGMYFEKLRIPALEAEIAKLNERIKALSGAQPQVNGQAQPAPEGRTSLTKDNYDPMAAVKEVTAKYNKLMQGG